MKKANPFATKKDKPAMPKGKGKPSFPPKQGKDKKAFIPFGKK